MAKTALSIRWFSRRSTIPWTRFFISSLMLLAVSPDSIHAASTAWTGNKNAKVRLVTGVQAIGSESRIDVGLEIQMAPGWHTYWRTSGDAGFAPIIDWKNSLNLASAKIAWPAPTRLSIEGLETYVYHDHVLFPIAITLTEPGDPLELHVSVDYAACKDICVPYHANLHLKLSSGVATPSEEASLIATAQAKAPRSLEAASIALLELSAIAVGKEDAMLTVRLRSSGALLTEADRLAYNVSNIESQFSSTFQNFAVGKSDAQLITSARERWQQSLSAYEHSLKAGAVAVQNLDSTRSQTGTLVASSQSAVGVLQATQAGNQLLGVQTSQVADLTAMLAAQGRANALEKSRQAAAQEQSREQFSRFLTGSSYSPTTVRMFHD